MMNSGVSWYQLIPQFTPNAHEYTYGTIRSDPDFATVELQFRPRPQSNMIHHNKFKWFKLVVALSWLELVLFDYGIFINDHLK